MKRSNVATYIGIFDNIRKIYAGTQEAINKKFTASMFSFNSVNGRCDACEGLGVVQKHIYFSADIMIECPKCIGKRYRDEILTIKWKGKNISEVLDMTVEEAREHFNEKKSIKEVLDLLCSIGIDYLTLGQISTSLSGGEAQRIKLTKHLARKNVRNTIFLFDEPTAGLHSHDIVKLLNMLQELVDKGNSVIFIEHNMNAVKTADHVIILGIENGTNNGKVINEGTPEKIVKNNDNLTTQYLKKFM